MKPCSLVQRKPNMTTLVMRSTFGETETVFMFIKKISLISRLDNQVSVAAVLHEWFLGQRADQETGPHGLEGGGGLGGGAAVFR